MVSLKRVYLYSVLAIALAPILVGLSDVLRSLFEAAADAIGLSVAADTRITREDLSLALALLAVATPIWLVHLRLLRGSMGVSEADDAEERSAPARATYFLVVLVVAGAVTVGNAVDLLTSLGSAVVLGERMWVLAAPVAAIAVFGAAWIVHVRWRSIDFQKAPARTAGDWLTRLYLYGVLFIAGTAVLFSISTILSTFAAEMIGSRPRWEEDGWWKWVVVEQTTSLIVASVAWATHWLMARRLLEAPPPMGSAHRRSRMRIGYFLGIALLGAIVVLAVAATSLMNVLTGSLDLWRPSQGSKLIDDIGGPLLIGLPFAVGWWWHQRRASVEALRFGGPDQQVSVVRAGRLLVSFVGLIGLATGTVVTMATGLELVDARVAGGVIAASELRDALLPGLALMAIGAIMWLPAWLRVQRARASDPVASAASTARRGYLLLVSGLAVVGLMSTLAWLVFQAIRMLLDVGTLEVTSWAISLTIVAGALLAYHVRQLRADHAVGRTSEPGAAPPAPVEASDMAGLLEVLEIRGPSGADLDALNSTIRANLPEGFDLRVRPVSDG